MVDDVYMKNGNKRYCVKFDDIMVFDWLMFFLLLVVCKGRVGMIGVLVGKLVLGFWLIG